MKKELTLGCTISTLLTACLTIAGCGGGGGGESTAPSTNSISKTSAESIAKSISRAATASMSSSAFKKVSLTDSLLTDEVLVNESLAKTLYSISCSETSCLINEPLSYRLTCTTGGRIEVTGNIDGSINNTGTGLIQIHATETISDWTCSPPYIVNGDPYISLSGTFSFMNGSPATQQHIGINGGFKWGTTAERSCQIHLDTNFDRNGGGRSTGSVCGYTVDIIF